MKCNRCGSEIESTWNFCPKCGSKKGGDPFDDMGRDLFSQVFGKMKNTLPGFSGMEREMEKDIEAIDLSPMFRRQPGEQPKRRGFTVRIRSGTGQKPDVDIKTFGGVRRENVERQIEDRFGVRPEKRTMKIPAIRKIPKKTEEPKAEIKRIGDAVAVDISLPGVKGTEDIYINELNSSVEVKAIAGDKAYFKILTKPENFRMKGKEFRNGVLKLLFS